MYEKMKMLVISYFAFVQCFQEDIEDYCTEHWLEESPGKHWPPRNTTCEIMLITVLSIQSIKTFSGIFILGMVLESLNFLFHLSG